MNRLKKIKLRKAEKQAGSIKFIINNKMHSKILNWESIKQMKPTKEMKPNKLENYLSR